VSPDSDRRRGGGWEAVPNTRGMDAFLTHLASLPPARGHVNRRRSMPRSDVGLVAAVRTPPEDVDGDALARASHLVVTVILGAVVGMIAVALGAMRRERGLAVCWGMCHGGIVVLVDRVGVDDH